MSAALDKLMRFKMAHGMWFAGWICHRMRGVPFNEPEPKLEDYTS